MRKVLLLLTLLLIGSCEVRFNDGTSIEEPSSVLILERKTAAWSNLLNQPEEKYYAYIYSETCGYCRKIEREIKEFETNHTLYYVLFTEEIPVKAEREDLTNVEDVNSLFILGTPTLFKISNKKVEKCYIGFYEIQEHIKEVSYLIE